jgi:hypothetical protein
VQSSPSDLWMRGYKVKVWRVGSRHALHIGITPRIMPLDGDDNVHACCRVPSAALSKPALPLLADSLLLLSLLLSPLAVIALSLAGLAVVLLGLTLA